MVSPFRVPWVKDIGPGERKNLIKCLIFKKNKNPADAQNPGQPANPGTFPALRQAVPGGGTFTAGMV
jgi:hypothetical protein